MTVYLVGAGPGGPGLLTRRGEELLRSADVVVHDRLVDASVLALADPAAELIDVGKRPGEPGGPRQEHINDLLVSHGAAGKLVVRLKGGDPFVFGRGGEEGEALDRAGVPWQVVPGVSSAFGVPATAGIPVTHRGLSTSVTVVTGHVGDPTAAGGVDWASLARAGGTIVVLMGMAQREEIARRLVDGVAPRIPRRRSSSGGPLRRSASCARRSTASAPSISARRRSSWSATWRRSFSVRRRWPTRRQTTRARLPRGRSS